MPIEYRIIKNRKDLSPLLHLESVIWGFSPWDSIPETLLQPMIKNDGAILIGAYDQETPIGLCFGFPVRQGGKWALWSHMTGVHPNYQGQNIGLTLKQYQREWALAQGYKRMSWTFDPLQRQNANFNLNHLGATVNVYHEDYYGEMTDALNAGMPSDRLEATWNITKAHKPKPAPPPQSEEHIILSANAQTSQVLTQPMPESASALYVEIPYAIRSLKQANKPFAIQWQAALRRTLSALFEQGYQITGFTQTDQHCWYVLHPPRYWFMYVVQCNDQSLYTGITTDIDHRIKTHNRGKGASYTASRRPVSLLAVWRFPNQSTALKAEAAFKKQSREDKMKRIFQGDSFHEGTFITKR